MFWGASIFNGDISEWDVSSVVDMAYMFRDAKSFNGEISNWDVSGVTSMASMFNAASFNGDLSKWDVSSVTTMKEMFVHSQLFHGDISKWDVSSVTDMNSMFSNAKAFNCDLSKWDVSNVQNMDHMFYDAASFTHILCSAAWARSTAAQSAKEMFTGSSGSLLAVSNKGCTAFDSKAELKLATTNATTATTTALHSRMFAPQTKNELKTAVDECLKCLESQSTPGRAANPPSPYPEPQTLTVHPNRKL